MSAYYLLLSVHSILRWLILFLLIIVIVRSVFKLNKDEIFDKNDNQFSLFLMIAAHLQLLVGIVLFFTSPNIQFYMTDIAMAMKEKSMRFFLVEHTIAMILGITFITAGRIAVKKETIDRKKFRHLLFYNSMALILIIWAIPWPFRDAIARPWI